jgi:uncharacterized coiled-coil DUF342 family protein
VLKDHSTDVNSKSSIVANIRKNGNSIEGSSKYVDSNLNTLTKFKKTLLEEQKAGEEKVESLNQSIESTKKEIDKQRMDLEDLRTRLKKVNEIKESEYTKFIELKNNLMEIRNKMKNLDEKANDSSGHKLRKERFDMINLSRNLDQIEKDIQTKKLTKDEERRLVARSREMATRLHSLKMIHKKEDDYRTISIQYDKFKTKINSIFQQKSELGDKIGKLKGSLDKLLNLRESLYEERRKARNELREAEAKLEMVNTQLNAIEYRRARQASFRKRSGNVGDVKWEKTNI